MITKEDLELQGITGSDDYLDSLIARAESIFQLLTDNTVNVPAVDITEKWDSLQNISEIYLYAKNPTVVKSVNGVTLTSGDYFLQNQVCKFKESKSCIEVFPYTLTIVYTAGFATVPEDIKHFLLSFCSYVHNTFKSEGITEFRQDLLTVKYGESQDISNFITGLSKNPIIAKYKNYYVNAL